MRRNARLSALVSLMLAAVFIGQALAQQPPQQSQQPLIGRAVTQVTEAPP